MAGAVGVVHGGVLLMLLLHGSVSHPMGPASPHGGSVFLVLNAFGIGFVDLLSQKRTRYVILN